MSDDALAAWSAPMVCTLGADHLRGRLDEIAALANGALLSYRQDGRTLRLRYAGGAAAQLEHLVAKEQDCCAFLQFDLRREADAVYLDITAPAEAGEFAPLLYAHFIARADVTTAHWRVRCEST